MTDYDETNRRGTALTKRPGAEIAAATDFSWVDPSWSARRRARNVGKTLEEFAGGLQVAKRFLDAATECQKSLQALEHARAERSLTPLRIEVERQSLIRDLQRGQQRGNVTAEEYEVDMLLRHEQKIQIHQRIKRLRQGRATAGPVDDTPPDLREPLATEQLVSRNREWIRRKIEEIRRQAANEGRPLTIEEIEQIDHYQDAEVASEASIRRRGASDL